MSALDNILGNDAQEFAASLTPFVKRELAPNIQSWDHDGADLDELYGLFDGQGLLDLLDLDELGTFGQRFYVLVALAKLIGEVDAGLAVGMVLRNLSQHLFGELMGLACSIWDDQVVALTAGASRMLSRAGQVFTRPASGEPLLGLRLGGAAAGVASDRIDTVSPEKTETLWNLATKGALAAALGSTQGALATATDYAAERYQGGKMIEGHYAIQKLLGGMSDAHQQAANALAAALVDVEAITGSFRSAFSFCEQAAVGGVQVLGGYGYMCEYGQEKRMRDAKALAVLFAR